MAEPRHSPLGGVHDRLAAASDDSTAIREAPYLDKLNLRLDSSDAEVVRTVRTATGCELPREPNTTATAGALSALWLGPDEWLLVAPDGGLAGIETAMREALAGRHHAITDVSAERTVLELAGDMAREVLAKGLSLDLDRLDPGTCAETALARAQIILHPRDARPTYHIYVRNSFAGYLASWLIDALGESRLSHAHLGS
ncbi:MAG: sarcosine oxidase subunit gamma [Alphaproteobacteria bacterium]